MNLKWPWRGLRNDGTKTAPSIKTMMQIWDELEGGWNVEFVELNETTSIPYIYLHIGLMILQTTKLLHGL
jgi:hypothetical protein